MPKLLILLFLLTACDSMDKLSYSDANFNFKIHEPIVDASPQAVATGKELTIKGQEFQQEHMRVTVNGNPSAFTFVNDKEIRVTVPANATTGKLDVVITQGLYNKKADNVYALADTTLTLITADPSFICDDMVFYNASGEVTSGTKKCMVEKPACTAEGQKSCTVSGDALKLVAASSLKPENIKAGVTIGGIMGNYDNTAAPCTTEGQVGCVVSGGSLTLASTSLLTTGNIKSGVTIAGVLGTYDNMPATCTSEAQTECRVSPANGLTLVLLAQLTQGNLRSGVTLAGVTGQYPNASYPLTTNSVTADLTDLNGQLTSNTGFEWWDATGARFTGNGDNKLSSGYILTGTTLFGQTGAVIPSPNDCDTDGQTACVAVADYPAAKRANITAWDLRTGKTFGGVSGGLKANCRNGVNSTLYNTDNVTFPILDTAGVSNDWWDTSDDSAGIMTRVSAWSTDTVCDASSWQDMTTIDGGSTHIACDPESTCIYQENNTGLQVTAALWTNSDSSILNPSTFSWSDALTACKNSTYGGYPVGTWRLPTQKELMNLYLNGSANLGGILFTSTGGNLMWSSTTNKTAGALYAMQVDWKSGYTPYRTKGGGGSITPVVCVK